MIFAFTWPKNYCCVYVLDDHDYHNIDILSFYRTPILDADIYVVSRL